MLGPFFKNQTDVRTYLQVYVALPGSVCPSHWHRPPSLNGHSPPGSCFEADLFNTYRGEKLELSLRHHCTKIQRHYFQSVLRQEIENSRKEKED